MVDVCILTGFGINSDYETKYAFELAGAENVKRVHLNDLINKKDDLENYSILALPGGFAYADDLGSGKVLANKFRYNLREDLINFINQDKLIIGICNGFQILVKMGILPAFEGINFQQNVSLVENASGKFEDIWVKLKPLNSPCIWTQSYKDNFEVPVRHGEGQFVVKNKDILKRIWEEELVPLVYDPNNYPNNPNGSIDGIAGLCDPSGHIFGMMPHPECHLSKYTHPLWTRGKIPAENGLKIFKNGVEYIRKKQI